jgi:uncharacterized membrane protein
MTNIRQTVTKQDKYDSFVLYVFSTLYEILYKIMYTKRIINKLLNFSYGWFVLFCLTLSYGLPAKTLKTRHKTTPYLL